MTKPIKFKLASLICAASLQSIGCLTPAAKAIEIDPNPNDGKCYFIENDLTVDYNQGNEYAGILNSNPWVNRIDSQEIAERTAQLFHSETGQNWRFAWKATGRNSADGGNQTDALNTWYYVRQNAYQPKPADSATGFYTSEYIVGSYRNHIGSFSLGAGFGRLNGGSNSYSNPLGKIYDHFKIRRDVDYGVGGSPSFRSWFTGDFSIFWGLQYNVPFANGMKLVIENVTELYTN